MIHHTVIEDLRIPAPCHEVSVRVKKENKTTADPKTAHNEGGEEPHQKPLAKTRFNLQGEGGEKQEHLKGGEHGGQLWRKRVTTKRAGGGDHRECW